jgi:hypothetical protein
MVKNGNLTFQNLITFYRPDDVDPESNGYRDMEDISRTQNILANIRARFETEKWMGCFIVEDVATVTDVDAKEKARDVGTVIDELIALADEFASLGWIYQANYTKENLTVTLRDGLTGFDNYFPVIYSGNVNILNTDIVFDTSIAVLIS